MPWARAVPPGGGSTAFAVISCSCCAEREKQKKQIFSVHSYLVPVAEIWSEIQESEIRESCSPAGCLLQVSWKYSVLQ